MSKLKLGAIADDRPVKFTVELPANVHRDLIAYAEVLAARRDCGQRMGAFADDVATHIRASLQTYRDADAGGAQALSS